MSSTQGDCAKHRQPLTVYCDEKDCKVMICPSCIVTKHRNHNCLDIPEKADEIKKNLAELRNNSQDTKDVFNKQIIILTKEMDKINKTASETLLNLDDTRNFLYQQVKEGIEAYKSQVIKTQQKNLKEIRKAIQDIERRKGGIQECHRVIDQLMNHDNPNEIIKSSELIISNFNDAVKQNQLEKIITFYETLSFQSKKHDNFKNDVLGQLETAVTNIKVPRLGRRPVPVKGTFVKSWPICNGCSVASDGEGVIFTDLYREGTSYLKSFDLDGNDQMMIHLGNHGHLRGLTHTDIEGQGVIVLSTSENFLEIRHSHNGHLIDFMRLSFQPADNAICITPDNKILLCNESIHEPSKVIEFEVRNMKLAQTEKWFYLPCNRIKGMCNVTQGNQRIVIATSCSNKQIVAVDYQTGDVAWRNDWPQCEGKDIAPYGITSDGEGHLFISDQKMVYVMTPDGKIHHTLLQNNHDAPFWNHVWVPDQRKLFIREEKQCHVYDITYECK